MRRQIPTISVLMTVYNRQQYIAEAIESVLASTSSPFEFIIVDDSSRDDSFVVAQSYAEKDNQIKVFKNQVNLGQFQNRNRAAELANGTHLMYVDSDDTIQPDAIAYLKQQLEKFPEVEYATIYHQKDIIAPIVLTSEEAIRRHFFKQSFLHIGPGGTVISKSLFQQIGGFPTAYGPVGDMYYNLKAACHSSVLLLPYNYLNYRVHEGQEINNRYSYLYNGYCYFNDIIHLPELPLSRQERDFLLKKNKRRFFVNSLRFLLQTRDVKRTRKAYQLAGFGLRDVMKAIVQ